MANTPVVVLDSTLTSIANAIRSKTGGSNTMTPSEMAAQILSISPVYETTSTTGAFYTDMVAPLKKLLVNITPIQSGSGTPSPTNVRPISGHTSVSVTVSPSATPSDGTTYTTALGQTVYGGTLDVLSGELTVDRAMVDLGTLNWVYEAGVPRFFAMNLQNVIKKPSAASVKANVICDRYVTVSFDGPDSLYSGVNNSCAVSTGGSVNVRDEQYTNATAFKTAMNGVQLCYELATPQTYQLTPQQIKTLVGNNTVTIDGGDIAELVYLSHVLPSGYQAASDLVACYRSSDDALGVYNLVNNVFTPAQ